MGVKILKREYKNQFYGNGSVTDWLLGNVGDWQRLELTFEASIDFIASNGETINIDEVINALILNNGKKWSDYGFDIGDDIVLTYTRLTDDDNDGTFDENTFSLTMTIINLYNDTMEVDETLDFGTVQIIPTDRGNFKIQDVRIATIKEPQGLKLRYSHLTNDNFDTNNIRSIIDNTVTEFSFAGLDNLINNINAEMNPDGLQSGMAIDRAFIKKLSGASSAYDVEYSLIPPYNARLNTNLVQFFSNPQLYIRTSAISLGLNPNSFSPEYKNSLGKAIPINQLQHTQGDFKNGDIDTIFLFNAQVTGIRYYEVSVTFDVNSTNDNSNSDAIHLTLFRYKNGSDLQFVQSIDVDTWQNASDYNGRTITYTGVIASNVDIGDSLALGIRYYHLPQNFTDRYVDITVKSAEVKGIAQGSTGAIGNTYLATIDFMMPTLFDVPTDVENRTLPRTLFNAGSLTDNFELEVFPEWNNPNTSIKNDPDNTERLGNTGWFDENFNGLDNNFKVESVKYTDQDGNILQQLDYNSQVVVEIVISGVKNLSSASEFGFGFAWIPQDEEDYKELTTPYHQNLLINTGRKFLNGINDSFNLAENTGTNIFEGNSATNARMDVKADNTPMFLSTGADTVTFKAVFIPTAEFTQLFENKPEEDRNYALWVSVADPTLRINFSDRVSLLADYNNMVKFLPPAGPYPGMETRFIEHPQNEDVAGTPKYFGFVEDDMLARVTFDYDTTTDKNFRSMIFGYEVENKVTGTIFELENYTVNLSQYPKDANGVQQFDFNDVRGFKLESGNNKNWVKVLRDVDSDSGTVKKYLAFFATKIRWEDWLSKEAPAEFFNADNENNGLNNDWIDYLRAGTLGDYKINFFVYTQLIDADGEFKNHKNTWEITFADYDENLNIETTHNYYRDSDNTLLNIGADPDTGKPLGVLLSDEPTRIEIIYENLTEDFDITKLYAVTTIEVDRGAGRLEHRQLSSVWSSENDNILIPLPSETKLKLEQIAPRVVKATCLVEPNRLTDALRYKVSGRLGCFSEGNGNNSGTGLYEEIYENKYE